MKIGNSIYILLLICSFSSDTFARHELIDLIEEELYSSLRNFDSEENEVDPNDRVDVKLWNKLNDEDIKNMPQIDDYSDEETAKRWLKWHNHISLRYHQVRPSNFNFALSLSVVGRTASRMESKNQSYR